MPWRTIVASTLIVLATIVAIEAILLTTQLIAWVVVIGFFAVVFAPAVRRVQDHVGGRRAIATAIVVFGTLATVLGILTVFVMPARTQLIGIISDLPGTIKDAGSAHGAVGKIVDSTRRVLAEASMRIEDVAWVLPHQPNGTMLEGIIAALGVDRARIVPVVQEIGSVACASIAVSLDRLMRTRPVASGDHVLMTGVGSGVSWGAILYRVG